MSTNVVTLTEAYGSTGQGWYLFAATGTLMDDQNLAIVTPVIQGNLDSSGNLSVALLASDNFSAGELTWSCFIEVKGQTLVRVQDFPVYFALGASQRLYTVLAAAGWTPTKT